MWAVARNGPTAPTSSAQRGPCRHQPPPAWGTGEIQYHQPVGSAEWQVVSIWPGCGGGGMLEQQQGGSVRQVKWRNGGHNGHHHATTMFNRSQSNRELENGEVMGSQSGRTAIGVNYNKRPTANNQAQMWVVEYTWLAYLYGRPRRRPPAR